MAYKRWMRIDQGHLTFGYGDGKIFICDITTGKYPWSIDFSKKNEGPIPPGEYTLDPHDISPVKGWKYVRRRFMGDWGSYRVKLEPCNVENIYDREGFYLHGGEYPGSAGCIDVGVYEKELFELIESTNTNQNDGSDEIIVTVTSTPNSERWEEMRFVRFKDWI